MSGAAVPSLFEWAGGEHAFRRLVDAFYDRVERDELLSPLFPDGVPESHRSHVTTWWVEVFGGTAGYTEELGGYEGMLAHHRVCTSRRSSQLVGRGGRRRARAGTPWGLGVAPPYQP